MEKKPSLEKQIESCLPKEIGGNYYLALITRLSDAYGEKAEACKMFGDARKEMFYIGKRDALNEAITHYVELNK